jgi:choline-glycine betaine transporter
MAGILLMLWVLEFHGTSTGLLQLVTAISLFAGVKMGFLLMSPGASSGFISILEGFGLAAILACLMKIILFLGSITSAYAFARLGLAGSKPYRVTLGQWMAILFLVIYLAAVVYFGCAVPMK